LLLAAASAGLRAASGLPPPAGARTARYLAAADRLGPGTGARLWERGLALPPEAAIDLATSQPVSAHPSTVGGVTGPGRIASVPSAAPSAPPSALTPRELEIAALIAAGRSNKAIAAELVISPATAARHVANIMTKLGFRSRAQIAAWATGRR
jgi:DNA-binding NarL/FixJ family response regulator